MGQQTLNLAQVYKLTPTDVLPVTKRGKKRSTAIQTCDRITKGNMEHGWRLVLASLQMG
jgi:hypothetical protein